MARVGAYGVIPARAMIAPGTRIRGKSGMQAVRSGQGGLRQQASLRSKRGSARLGVERGRSMRAAPATRSGSPGFRGWPRWPRSSPAWAAPAAHADERNEPAAVTTAGAAAGEPDGASQDRSVRGGVVRRDLARPCEAAGPRRGASRSADSNEDQFLDPDDRLRAERRRDRSRCHRGAVGHRGRLLPLSRQVPVPRRGRVPCLARRSRLPRGG